MKKIYYMIAVAALLLTSCDDFLNRSSKSSISSDNVFESKDLAEGVVIGVYANLAYDYNAYDRVFFDAYASPLDALTRPTYLAGNIQSNNSMFLTYWKRFYEGINRANDVINNISRTPDMSEELKGQRIAECKFLRAWHYYRLNCLWRGVPIYLENLAPQEYTRPRDTEEKVWRQIISDCTDCIGCEAIPDKYAADSPDYGRITRGAAYALRGKVYMWLKDWPAAEADFKKVGECGYGLYTAGSYASLFKEENERCTEMVFSAQMVETANSGNCMSFIYGNFNTAGYGNNRIVANAKFIDSYEFADGKPFSWDDVIPGYSDMDSDARSIYFCRDAMTDSEKLNMATAGADLSLYLTDGNEDRIRRAFENRDPRLKANFILPYSTYLGGSTGKDETYTMRFPYRSDVAPYYDLKAYNTTQMLYLLRKFVAEGTKYKNISYNPVDMPLIRYADVLLSLAEAVNEQGGRTSEAVGYVNQVRQRAGVRALGTNEYTQVTDQENLRERIRNEKKWELVGENQLYCEELRWGSWDRDKFSDGNGLLQCWGSAVHYYKYGGDHYYRWPIPRSEIEKAGLTQNEKWF